MTPPEAPEHHAGNTPPAASLCIRRMRNRRQFLAAARGRRQVVPSMLVQAHDRRDADPSVHVGFTCSKKVGNAVARNRAKRRLRAVAQEVLTDQARPGWDYVLIGKREATAARDYADLRDDLLMALERLHR